MGDVLDNLPVVTPGELLGYSADIIAGNGAYVATDSRMVYSTLTGRRRFVPPQAGSDDPRPTVEVIGLKARGAVPEPGSVVIARVTKVMARNASADIMCVDSKSVKEKFTGIIRQQDVRATEIDKVDMFLSFRPGDIIRALVISLGDARAYYLSTAKNELGVVSAQSLGGRVQNFLHQNYFVGSSCDEAAVVGYYLFYGRATMVPISWTEMQCPVTGQIEQRKVAKVC